MTTYSSPLWQLVLYPLGELAFIFFLILKYFLSIYLKNHIFNIIPILYNMLLVEINL
jgi:hypothetical protein